MSLDAEDHKLLRMGADLGMRYVPERASRTLVPRRDNHVAEPIHNPH